MADEEEHFETCDECGATIYPEHLEKGMAEQWRGKLLCVHCLKDIRSAAAAAESTETAEEVPIALVEADDSEIDDGGLKYDTKPTAIRSFGSGPGGMGEGLAAAEEKLHRAMLKDSPNATRARVFHCKLADAALVYITEQINEWTDSNDDIQIKFATSCIGVVEGKHADPHLIVTVFY
ncbi:MAG: hypothetical protein KAY37_05100 [Phycisphaerae bacterium]|nr:hypothetical protein [Phycisphaerae bacterium]